jgi:hypothetical protein
MTSILGIVASSKLVASGSYESIATVNGTGSSSTITFSSIPSTYKHLQIRALATSTTAASSYGIKINSDSTGSNYKTHRINAAADSVTSTASGYAGSASIAGFYYGDNTTYFTGIILDLIDYANTSKYKTFRTFTGVNTNTSASNNEVSLVSNLWMNTSAVTSIEVFTNGTAWNSNSVFSLYGIKG